MKNVTVKNQNSHSSRIGKTLLGLAMCSVLVVSQAAQNEGVNNNSFTIKIVDSSNKTDANPVVSSASTSKSTMESAEADTQSRPQSTTNRTVRLNEGGVIWVSSDPVSLTPQLDVAASSSVKLSGKTFDSPLSFTLNTNYAAFIDRWELVVYKASDEDERRPLKSFKGSGIINGQKVSWDGDVASDETLIAGDELKYILTVHNKTGHSDVTRAREISIQSPGRYVKSQDKDQGISLLSSNLERQTIPLYGSRVRIHGNDIGKGNSITVDGEAVRVSDRRFVVERLLPEGKHDFDVKITADNKSYNKTLNTSVDGRYMFMVGLADVTVGEGQVSSNIETLSDGDKYLDGDIFIDGRLAFYLKGKVKGKYLITAQMDTGTAEIDELFDDIHKKDAASVFSRLDPDKYYPVYGDDSTITDDTNSQGKMYVRVDWDKSRAIWGNFNTDMTGTELSSFNRSLYGAKVNHKSTQVTENGDHKTDVTVFGSETQSAFGHNQFLGTGGSLYYLKDTDIVVGSEKIWVEVRDGDSDTAVSTIVMEEGRDYQIDDFQGRIILNRPLLQIVEQENPSLVKDDPLDGDNVYLMVDYEYVPDDFDADKVSYGGRGKAWLGDHFAVGGTYVHENRDDDDYELKGLDFTLKKSKGTYLVAEYAESEALQTEGSFQSTDGGLNFDDLITDDGLGVKTGTAYSVEARVNLDDISDTKGAARAWYKHRDANFSVARLSQGTETINAGAEAIVDATDKLKLSARATILDKIESTKVTTASLQGDYRVNNRLTVGAEIRHIQEEDQSATTTTTSSEGEGTLAAFKVGYDVNDAVNLYLIGQGTLENSGTYESNDLVTIGARAKVSKKIALSAELSAGDRGEAATLGADYRLNDGHNFYTNYTLSTDTTFNKRNLFTVGQRKSVSNRLKVFTEHQFTHESDQSGLGHSFGVDYDYNKDVTLSSSVQTAQLDQDSGGTTDRDAFSVGLSYEKGKSTGSTRLEYRRDKSSDSDTPEETEQWVTTNRLNYRLNPSMRLQSRLNYSVTKDVLSNDNDAQFAEAGLGFAYRPVNHDRLNVLGRLTYLYDLQPLSQSTDADERSVIASVESSYQVNRKWQLGGKLAHKESQIRTDRDTGEWSENDATLASAKVTYHVSNNWDAMAQYHWLNSDASGDMQHGALLSVDRHLGKNMKVGIGYNFTTFSDDIRDDDGDAKGWFINLVGKF